MTQGWHFYFSLLDSFDKEQTLYRCKSEALQEQVKQWRAACISFFSHVCELFYKVDDMVEGLEQELEGITDSGDFAAYQVHDLFVQMSTSQDMLTDPSFHDPDDFASFQEFLTNYSGTLLHPNHFLLTTARRNLIQFLCYRSHPLSLSLQTFCFYFYIWVYR